MCFRHRVIPFLLAAACLGAVHAVPGRTGDLGHRGRCLGPSRCRARGWRWCRWACSTRPGPGSSRWKARPTGAFASRASLRAATASRRPRRVTRPRGWPTSKPAVPGCDSSSPMADGVCPAASSIAAVVLARAPRFGWRAASATTAMSSWSKPRPMAVGTPWFPRVTTPPMRFSASDYAAAPRALPGDRDSVDLVLDAVWPPGPPPAAVVDWVRAHEIPLTTVEGGQGPADLAPLRAIVGDARAVGLGEATHGTREIFQLKHRMLEYLVGEMGFNVLAIETGLPESFAIEDYVLGGPGDPEQLLAAESAVWKTEELRDVVRWMREWNRTHTRKVHFQGLDMRRGSVAARDTLAYLERTDRRDAVGAVRAGIRPRGRSCRSCGDHATPEAGAGGARRPGARAGRLAREPARAARGEIGRRGMVASRHAGTGAGADVRVARRRRHARPCARARERHGRQRPASPRALRAGRTRRRLGAQRAHRGRSRGRAADDGRPSSRDASAPTIARSAASSGAGPIRPGTRRRTG